MLYRKSLLAIGGLLMFAAFLAGCGSPTTSNVTVVQLNANSNGCSPDSFNTSQGFLIKITFNNTGSADATLSFPDVPYTLTAPAGKIVPGNFTAPTKTGSYKYQCGPSGSQSQGTMKVGNSQ